MILAVLLAAAPPPPADFRPVAPVDGGICVGVGWVPLEAGESATVDRRTDGGAMFAFAGPGRRWWYLYVGPATPLRQQGSHQIGRLTFRRFVGRAGFSGYAARLPYGRQLRINGLPVTADPAGLAFLGRIRFGADRPAGCNGS